MIPVLTLYNTTIDIVRVTQNGNINNEEFNRALGVAEQTLYNVLRERAGENSEIQMALTEFQGTYAPPQNPNGVYAFPADYFQYRTLSNIVGVNGREVPINVLDDYKWQRRSTSKLISLARNPIARLAETNIQILPETVFLRMFYWKKLIAAYYAVTYDAFDNPIYDPLLSVDSMFMESQLADLVALTLVNLGIELRDATLIQAYNNINIPTTEVQRQVAIR